MLSKHPALYQDLPPTADEEKEIEWYRKENEKGTFPWRKRTALPKPPSTPSSKTMRQGVHPLKLKAKCKSQPPVRKEPEEDLSFFEEWANDEKDALYEDWAMELEAGVWADNLLEKDRKKKVAAADSQKFRSRREYERVVRNKYRGRKGQYQYGQYSWKKW